MAQDLLEHGAVEAHQAEAVDGRLHELQAAVARHGVDDVDQQRLRHGVPRVRDQGVDHLLGVVPGGARVPQRERGDAVGVDVLGRTLEFGERGDGGAGLRGELVIHLEQERLVGLDDEWSVGH